jgi:hypothetical protein
MSGGSCRGFFAVTSALLAAASRRKGDGGGVKPTLPQLVRAGSQGRLPGSGLRLHSESQFELGRGDTAMRELACSSATLSCGHAVRA